MLAAWSGLGYNRRALALHRAGTKLAAEGWPATTDGLEALPGVGRYTARAVAALAFGRPVGAVDTNVRRWLVRRFGIPAAAPPAQLQAAADALAGADAQVTAAEAAAWMHASMEFGAMVCMARRPACADVSGAQRLPVTRYGAHACPCHARPAFANSERSVRGRLLRELSVANGHAIPMARARAVAGGHEPRRRARPAGARGTGPSQRRLAAAGPAAGSSLYNRLVTLTAPGLRVSIGEQMPSVGLRATDGYLLNLRTFVSKSPSIIVFFAGPSLKGAKRAVGDLMATTLAEAYPRLQRAGIGLVMVTTDSEAQQAAYVAELQLPYLLYCDERRTAVELLGIPTPQRARQRQRRADGLRASRSTARSWTWCRAPSRAAWWRAWSRPSTRRPEPRPVA